MSTDHPAAELATLANGVRVLAIPQAQRRTADVGVYVRTGSAHESRADNGISHVLEHMAFKGTTTRDVHRVNLDAERLGAEVNAHTDKDHTAYTMRGLGRDAPAFVAMLADIVCHATFPADELERERAVILQEVAEVEDEPMTVAYQLFDHACWGLHPAALPVIGQRRHIERFTRAELQAYVERQYTGANVVVAAAGAIDPAAILRAAEAAFGALPAGAPNVVAPPVYVGGLRSKRMEGGGQVQLVLGFPGASLAEDDMTDDVAAAVLGDGMSSPLLAELREKRGLVYHAACVADRFDFCGQLAIEASCAAERLGEVLHEVALLLQRAADGVDPVDLERARHQVAVRLLRDAEQPMRRLEDSALGLFATGRLHSADARVERALAVDAAALRATIERLHAAGMSAALTGPLPRHAAERARERLGDWVRA